MDLMSSETKGIYQGPVGRDINALLYNYQQESGGEGVLMSIGGKGVIRAGIRGKSGAQGSGMENLENGSVVGCICNTLKNVI